MSDEKKVDTSDEKKPQAETEKAPPAEATKSITEVRDGPISAATLRVDRMWAAAGYFSPFAGFWVVVPIVAYVWRGRHSRFVAFHAVQALLLQVAFLPILFVGTGVSLAFGILLDSVTSHRVGHALANLVQMLVYGSVFMVPVAATVWLGLCALRGEDRALPIIGSWAKKIVQDVGDT